MEMQAEHTADRILFTLVGCSQRGSYCFPELRMPMFGVCALIKCKKSLYESTSAVQEVLVAARSLTVRQVDRERDGEPRQIDRWLHSEIKH